MKRIKHTRTQTAARLSPACGTRVLPRQRRPAWPLLCGSARPGPAAVAHPGTGQCCQARQPLLRPVWSRGRRRKPGSPVGGGTARLRRSVHRGPAVAMGLRPPLPLATARGTEARRHWPGQRARRPPIGPGAAQAQRNTTASPVPPRGSRPLPPPGAGNGPAGHKIVGHKALSIHTAPGNTAPKDSLLSPRPVPVPAILGGSARRSRGPG